MCPETCLSVCPWCKYILLCPSSRYNQLREVFPRCLRFIVEWNSVASLLLSRQLYEINSGFVNLSSYMVRDTNLVSPTEALLLLVVRPQLESQLPERSNRQLM